MKSVLLTGAGGFVGRTTIRHLLERGFVVHAVSAKPIGAADPNLFYHDVDLLDGDDARRLIEATKPSHLLHFAWYVKHGKFWNATENLDWVAASLNLLQSFAASGGKRVVMAGTCFEYDHTGQEKLSETGSPLDPQTLYATSKHSLHLILQKYAEQVGLSHAWGRIFFLYGGYEQPNRFVPSVVNSLLRNEEAKCSHGEQIRDFMFVDDAGEGFVQLLDSEVRGAVNIAGGVPYKIKDIAAMIAEIIGKPELLRLGALPSSPGEPASIVADISRLENEVGFRAKTDLRARLEKTIDWWKAQFDSANP